MTDKEYATHLLHLAERCARAPKFIQTLPEEELIKAWQWLGSNVLNYLNKGQSAQDISLGTYELGALQRFFESIKVELARRDNKPSAAPVVDTAVKVGGIIAALEWVRRLSPAYIIGLVGLVGIFWIGGKIIFPDGTSVESDGSSAKRVAPQVIPSTKQESGVTILGRVNLNGKLPSNEIRSVRLRSISVNPMRLDGEGTFVFKDVSLPSDKLITLEFVFNDNQIISGVFATPTPEAGVVNLGEVSLNKPINSSKRGAGMSREPHPPIIVNEHVTNNVIITSGNDNKVDINNKVGNDK